MPDMVAAAIDYVAQGFRVFPCKLDKTPLTEHGLKDATQLKIGVQDYWGRWPNAGIGLVTDGFIVIDFDVKNKGLESKAVLETKFGTLPRTRTHRTGGGGLHLIYRNPNGSNARNAVAIGGYQGVDLRANGGYIVAPPSLHESGKRYEVIDGCEIAPAPEWLMVLVTKRLTLLEGSISSEQLIPEGQRDATLASLAGTMRRRGLPQTAIEAALLEVNRLQCQPPLPESDVRRIASSISRYPPEPNTEQTEHSPETLNKLNIAPKTENSEQIEETEGTVQTYEPSQGRIIWRLVDDWMADHQGERFDLDTICRHLDMKTREQRQHVAKKLSYEVGRKKLEKLNIAHGSLYRYIDNTYVNIDWLNASPSPPLTIKWPYGIDDDSHFGFDGHVIISPGDVIVVAGVSNMGKTLFCLNLLWNNMDIYPCTLMGNEYEAGKFKRRISRMHWANPIDEGGKPKFELIERYENWKDIIRPDNINIIDWIELSDNFYQIGSIIEGIKSKLRDGIAVISLQKSSGKELGLGGGFSQHIASLYLAIDFERLTVVKAKEWFEVNPNGKMYGFQITDGGTKFANIREVKKCLKCGGAGKVQFGECQVCLGKGCIDL